MDTRETLAMIIARCPELAHQAAGALRAYLAGSPIVQRRMGAVVSDALRLYGDDFSEDERRALDSMAPAPNGGKPRRDLNLIVRATAAEKARVQALADAAGRSVSDYIRARLGL